MTEFVLAPKQALAVIVMIAIIMVCVLAPFGAAHAIVGVSTAAVTILVAALAAIGITFTSTGVFDNIEEYVESLLQEYAVDNNIPVTSIFNGSQWAANKAGKLIINNRFVQLVSSFATWVKVKFNLMDNSSYNVITPGITINGLTVYQCPIYLDGSVYDHEYTIIEADDSVYVVFVEANSGTRLYFFSHESGRVDQYRYNQYTNSHTTLTLTQRTPQLYIYPYYVATGQIDGRYSYETYSTSAFNEAFGYGSDIDLDINNIGVGIKTGAIDIPMNRDDYEDGDGALVDVGGQWLGTIKDILDRIREKWSSVQSGEQVNDMELVQEDVLEAELPQQTDVENIPGATIPGIPNINGEPWHLEFSNLWHYVAQWISDMSAGGAVIWNTCIQAPPPVVNLVFAGIVLAMWFGAIKILR